MTKIKLLTNMMFLFLVIFVCASTIIASDTINKKKDGEKTSEVPEISFEEQVYDFGRIFTGESVKHEFKFKNIGKSELIIKDVKSSCGCTAALVSKNILQKEESGEVAVKFNAGQYVGKVTKSVVVNSNDPVNQKYKLTITGEVIEEVSVNPKRINFGIIRRGDSCTKKLEIKTVPKLNIEVKKVETPNPYITIVKNNTIDDSISYMVTVANYDYIGKFSGMVFVYTSSKKQERVDVPFSGEIVGDMTFYPEILSFGNVKAGQDVKRTVIINFINKDVKIEKIETETNNIDYIVSDLNETGTKKIDVKLRKEITIGKITGNIRIYTNSNLQPVIQIPITGEIKG